MLLVAKVHHAFNVSDLANFDHILLLVELVIAKLSRRFLYATLVSLLLFKVRLHVQNLQLFIGLLPLLLSRRQLNVDIHESFPLLKIWVWLSLSISLCIFPTAGSVVLFRSHLVGLVL